MSKIETNRRINARLEELAGALFKSWFIDFTPFGGQMPEDWEEASVDELVDIQSGFPFKSNTYVESGKYKLITIKAVQDGYLELNGAVCIDDIPNKMPQFCYLHEGDILLSLTGNVGRVCVINSDNLLLNQRVAKLKPRNENNYAYIYLLFRQQAFKETLISMSNGTAQLNLSPIAVGKLNLMKPSDDISKLFNNAAAPILRHKINLEQESARLAALRDELLPKLMSGELKVAD